LPFNLFQIENASSNGGCKVLLKETTKDEEGRGVADGDNGNARYYLQQAKRVHASVKPTDDEEMVS
jgi:hypothetical protein